MSVCVIGAGPCGLTSLKNLKQAGIGDVVCYEAGSQIGGNWVNQRGKLPTKPEHYPAWMEVDWVRVYQKSK